MVIQMDPIISKHGNWPLVTNSQGITLKQPLFSSQCEEIGTPRFIYLYIIHFAVHCNRVELPLVPSVMLQRKAQKQPLTHNERNKLICITPVLVLSSQYTNGHLPKGNKKFTLQCVYYFHMSGKELASYLVACPISQRAAINDMRRVIRSNGDA